MSPKVQPSKTLIYISSALIAWTLGTKMTALQWGGIALSTFGVILSQYSPKQS